MAIYDTEEEQIEQLKKWWEANNTSLIAGVISAIVLVTGWNLWQNHQLGQRQQASQLYQNLLDGAGKNDNASVEKLADQLAAEHGSSAYAHFAALAKAKSKVAQGDLEAAKAILQQQIQKAGTEELQHVARLRLVQLLLATGQHEEGLKLIAAVDPSKTEGFSASYDELEGDLYVAMNRLDDARNAYQNAIRTGQATALAQFKLDDIAAPAFDPANAN
ncbi:MAG: tetratricopeptide repeat protein [Methylomonas sp.]|nr:tetratricopeptide repeat protein [Methylomonas sp.]